jgi:RND superfamily putative drug exporter
MLTRIAGIGLRRPKIVLAVAGLVLVLGALFGGSVASHLKTGGYTDPGADSTVATHLLDKHFHGGGANLVFLISSPGGLDGAAARAAGVDIVTGLKARADWVSSTSSYWTVPDPAAAGLVSADGTYALVAAHVLGDDNQMQDRARSLAAELEKGHAGATVQTGGSAFTYAQVTDRTKEDLKVAELISIPLTAIALILVFGSMIASLLPLAIGILSIVGTLAILRLLSMITDVSIYAMNMTTALGLALAIDYSLFMVSRYREELRRGASVPDAVTTTVRTAGRTVLFSALTVALSLAALAVFPMYFLRSFAYAGVAVVGFAVLASLFVLPAALGLIGHRINAWDLRHWVRRALGRPDPVEKPLSAGFWYRNAKRIMRRPVAFGLAVTALFLVLGAPFLKAHFGYPDDRVLTTEASGRQVGDILRADFARDPAAGLTGVVSSIASDPSALQSYTAAVSKVSGVESVTSGAGTFVAGRQVGPAPSGFVSGDAAMFSVSTGVDPFSDAGTSLVKDVRAIDAPWHVSYTGWGAFNVDAMAGLGAKLPLALGLIALATFVVLFLFTGSVVLPLKALLMNTLSLSATFGAMVWIFQDGHFSSLLGFTPTGYLVANMVILMFCLAFGMSMDYEVFLLSRIRESWVASARTDADNEEAVAYGIAHTGRIVTAAAALMAIVFAAMVTSSVAFMQLFGLGLTIAVLADATLVRSVLVPAFMKLMGRANWWAPRPLARFHERFGLREEVAEPTVRESVPA